MQKVLYKTCQSKNTCSTGTPNLNDQVNFRKSWVTIRGVTQCTKYYMKLIKVKKRVLLEHQILTNEKIQQNNR